MTATRFLDDDLLAENDDGPALLGSRCRACGTTTFPRQPSCPRCTRMEMADTPLPRRGTLWSFTVQSFRPGPPFAGSEAFVPYGVGYIDLAGTDQAGTVLVEAVLTENDPEKLHIGQPMEMVLVTLRLDDDGTRVLTYAFAPAR